jgi:hypothetical protein
MSFGALAAWFCLCAGGCASQPVAAISPTSSTPLFNASGVGHGPVKTLHFTVPSAPWTLGWTNSCPQGYAAVARAFHIVGVGTVGNHTMEWYDAHTNLLWNRWLARSTSWRGEGVTTVLNHRGDVYLQINSFCRWHVTVWLGAEEAHCPSPLGITGLPRKAPPPIDIS